RAPRHQGPRLESGPRAPAVERAGSNPAVSWADAPGGRRLHPLAPGARVAARVRPGPRGPARLRADAPERLRGLGRYPELRGDRLARARVAAAAVDRDREPRRPLHAGDLADLRGRLHAVGALAAGVPRDEPARSRARGRPLLPGRPAAAGPRPRRDGVGGARRRGRGGAPVRPASPAGRVGGVGDGAPGRGLGRAVPGDGPALSPGGGGGAGGPPALARRLVGAARGGAPVEGDHDDRAGGAAAARRLPAPAAAGGPAAVGARRGPGGAPGEAPLSRAERGRRGAGVARPDPRRRRPGPRPVAGAARERGVRVLVLRDQDAAPGGALAAVRG